VPEHQRVYQAAYKAHERVWRIVSASPAAPGNEERVEEKGRTRDGNGEGVGGTAGTEEH
jgi:hypothetical protein